MDSSRGASSTNRRHYQPSSKDENQLLMILESIHEMDENLKMSRTDREERQFRKNLKMCVSTAHNLGKSSSEKSSLLVQCYLQIIAARNAPPSNKGRRKSNKYTYE